MDQRYSDYKKRRNDFEKEYLCEWLTNNMINEIFKKINDNKQYAIFRPSQTLENTIVSTLRLENNEITNVRYQRSDNGCYLADTEDMEVYETLKPEELVSQFNNTEIIVLNRKQVLAIQKNAPLQNKHEDKANRDDDSNQHDKPRDKRLIM